MRPAWSQMSLTVEPDEKREHGTNGYLLLEDSMIYKGYSATIKFDEDADIFHGEVANTRDVITFQGRSVDELRAAFRDSLDEYLKFCEELEQEPEKPFSGKIALRIPSALHRMASAAAQAEDKSLNAWLTEAVQRAAGEQVQIR